MVTTQFLSLTLRAERDMERDLRSITHTCEHVTRGLRDPQFA